MEQKIYVVENIQGEYADLKDTESGEMVFIAMALLPEGIDIGTKLLYEMFSYTVL